MQKAVCNIALNAEFHSAFLREKQKFFCGNTLYAETKVYKSSHTVCRVWFHTVSTFTEGDAMVDKRDSGKSSSGATGTNHGKKLLDRAMDAMLDAGFEQGPATRYVGWMRQYILFHNKRHPQEMGVTEIEQYLASQTFGQPGGREQRAEAERALKFLYEQVLRRLWPRDVRSGEQRAESTERRGDGGHRGAAGGRKASDARGQRLDDKARYLNGRQEGVQLLDRVRNAVRVAQYALDTEKIYVNWARRYMEFHAGRRAEDMGAKEVEQFLTHLAVDRQVAAKSQRQALNALVFLYETVLGVELGRLMPVRGRHGARVPVVMTRREVPVVLERVEGARGLFRLMCEVMYGSGLRIRECCRVRVKDVELERRQLAVRNGKGDHDRMTVLPDRLVEPLRKQIERVRRVHEQDLARGFGRVWLPLALRRQVSQRGTGARLAVCVSVVPAERGSTREGKPGQTPAPFAR